MPDPDPHEQSISELLQQASQQSAKLVRDEIRLAQLELQEKGKRIGIGAGMFGGSGVVALYAVGSLLAGAILLLATALEPWLAALIVAAGLGAVAGLLALRGKKQVERAVPPVPERTVQTVQQDVQTVKRRAKRGKAREPTLEERMMGQGNRRSGSRRGGR